jgi:hypothetical protein
MPELPDVAVYVEALERRILGQPLERVRLASPFVLRSVDPPVAEVEGRGGWRTTGSSDSTAQRGPRWSSGPIASAGRRATASPRT